MPDVVSNGHETPSDPVHPDRRCARDRGFRTVLQQLMLDIWFACWIGALHREALAAVR